MPGTCWFTRGACDRLLSELQGWPLRETGGALLGRREGDLAVVETVLGPGPEAHHGLSSFEPDHEWQQAEGARIYRESGRTVAYLGDWHSHPRGPALPSTTDQETAKMIAAEEAFRAPRPLYAIATKRWYQRREPAWRVKMMELFEGELAEMELITLEA